MHAMKCIITAICDNNNNNKYAWDEWEGKQEWKVEELFRMIKAMKTVSYLPSCVWNDETLGEGE